MCSFASKSKTISYRYKQTHGKMIKLFGIWKKKTRKITLYQIQNLDYTQECLIYPHDPQYRPMFDNIIYCFSTFSILVFIYFWKFLKSNCSMLRKIILKSFRTRVYIWTIFLSEPFFMTFSPNETNRIVFLVGYSHAYDNTYNEG